jgi:hypothetical protein
VPQAVAPLDAIEAQLSARGGLDVCLLDVPGLMPADLDPLTVERLVQTPTPTPLTAGGAAPPGAPGMLALPGLPPLT